MAAAAGVTFGFGIVAAGPEVVWLLRGLAAVLFIAGVGTCLDAIVFTSSWRMTSSALKVPTLSSRDREIVGRDDLVVALDDRAWSRLTVTGPNGTRSERINPLVSGTDLRRWWDSLPD